MCKIDECNIKNCPDDIGIYYLIAFAEVSEGATPSDTTAPIRWYLNGGFTKNSVLERYKDKFQSPKTARLLGSKRCLRRDEANLKSLLLGLDYSPIKGDEVYSYNDNLITEISLNLSMSVKKYDNAPKCFK